MLTVNPALEALAALGEMPSVLQHRFIVQARQGAGGAVAAAGGGAASAAAAPALALPRSIGGLVIGRRTAESVALANAASSGGAIVVLPSVSSSITPSVAPSPSAASTPTATRR
jgi:hypothetical protein